MWQMAADQTLVCVKRSLHNYGFPPDMAKTAPQLVL
jgi:hypothetical protein